jgi:hypothetical protein
MGAKYIFFYLNSNTILALIIFIKPRKEFLIEFGVNNIQVSNLV